MNEKDIVTLPSIIPTSIPGEQNAPGSIDTWMVKGNYSISTFGYADNFDANYNFVLPFYIDQNVTAINQVILNLLFQKYRAFAKTASSGGGSAATSSTASLSITTTDTPGQTAHQHTITFAATATSEDSAKALGYRTLMVQPGAGGSAADCDDGSDIGKGWATEASESTNDCTLKTNCTIDGHSHNVSIAGHAHSVTIPAHTHDLTFGIYEATDYPTNVEILIDSVDRTAALGGPWNPLVGTPSVVNLDLTKYITTIGSHTLELSTDDMGRCIPMLWIKTQSKK
jgi:hypothetical protein